MHKAGVGEVGDVVGEREMMIKSNTEIANRSKDDNKNNDTTISNVLCYHRRQNFMGLHIFWTPDHQCCLERIAYLRRKCFTRHIKTSYKLTNKTNNKQATW